MEDVMGDDTFGREDAPPEVRLPPIQRALRVVRPEVSGAAPLLKQVA